MYQMIDLEVLMCQQGVHIYQMTENGLYTHIPNDRKWSIYMSKLNFRYNKSPAQVLIRWCVQQGYITIPKSSSPERIIANTDVFDWSIKQQDILLMVSWLVVSGPTTSGKYFISCIFMTNCG
jgi:diketogulonate reductase-like aldo/keto reductase